MNDLNAVTQAACPGLCQIYGIRIDSAAVLLVAAGYNPGQIRFAQKRFTPPSEEQAPCRPVKETDGITSRTEATIAKQMRSCIASLS
jgi:hypothetical protein